MLEHLELQIVFPEETKACVHTKTPLQTFMEALLISLTKNPNALKWAEIKETVAHPYNEYYPAIKRMNYLRAYAVV